MSRNKIEMILNIHKACTEPLYAVLNGITEKQLNWKPAPESRSTNEIMWHLIRVDKKFLLRLGQETKPDVPSNGTAIETLNALENVHKQLHHLVEGLSDDSLLFKKSPANDAKETDTINELVLHSCQHNLYHLSQVIYLRRALDRAWTSPIMDWDKATRIIANYLSPKPV
jgi:uncharacterized damage-inducible protein DinB